MEVSLIISGIEYSLSNGVYSVLRSWDGTGLTDIDRISSSGPQQIGDTDQGKKDRARYVTLILGVPGEDPSDFDDRRDDLLRLLKPTRTNKKLKFTLDNGNIRYLDTVYYNGLQMYERSGRRHGVFSPTFKAPFPHFYGSSESATFGQSGGGGGFTVPTPVPTPIGGSSLGEFANITYEGTAITFPAIRITGPVTDPILTNLSTDEIIDFTGHTIASGDYYDIDLRYAFKRVLDQDGIQVFPSEDSDMATFHFDTDPDVPGGVNSLQFTGSAVNSSTRVDITWLNLYEYL